MCIKELRTNHKYIHDLKNAARTIDLFLDYLADRPDLNNPDHKVIETEVKSAAQILRNHVKIFSQNDSLTLDQN